MERAWGKARQGLNLRKLKDTKKFRLKGGFFFFHCNRPGDQRLKYELYLMSIAVYF